MKVKNHITHSHYVLNEFFSTYMSVVGEDIFLNQIHSKQQEWSIHIPSLPEATEYAAAVGTAFDHLVRATTWGLALDNTVAAKVIYNQLLIRNNQWLKDLWKNLKSQWPAHISPPDDTLIAYTVILAYIEDIYRVGGRWRAIDLIKAFQQNLGLNDMVATIPDAVIRDLHNLLDYYQTTQAANWINHEIYENPTFVGSDDVGGADADWIIDQTLWDMKTTKYAYGGLHNDIHQILGYALLDYTDQYHIKQVGLYYARFGTTLQWSVNELLHELSGESYSLEKWRKIFQKFVSNP